MQSCIVLLLGLGAVASAWPVPKTLELKLYAVFVCVFVAWCYFSRLLSRSLGRPSPFFWIFLSLYFPLVAAVNALEEISPFRAVLLCLTGAAGLLLWAAECRFVSSEKLSKRATSMLFAGIIIAIVLTLLLSVGNTFNILSPSTVAVFGLCWLVFEKIRLPVSDVWFALGIALLLIPLFFFVRVGYTDVVHYAYLLGPVVETLHGHRPLAEIAPQYGAGLTVALAEYFRLLGSVSNGGLVALLRVLTFIQFLLVFFIAWSLCRSRSLAVCALVSALFFAYFSQGNHYFAFPSTGFLRFGFPLMIAAVYCIPSGAFSVRFRPHVIALLAAVSSLWSFESMVYTVPAVCAAEFTGRRLGKFIPLLVLWILFVWGTYILTLVFGGHAVDLSQYVEYPFLFAGGYGLLPLQWHTTLWWLFPPIALLGIAVSLWDEQPDECVVLLSVYALAIFTYFVGRAHPNNLHHVSLPFILLLFFFVSRIADWRWLHAAAASLVAVFVSANMSFYEPWSALRAMSVLGEASVQEIRGELAKPVYDECDKYSGFEQYVRSGRLALLDISLYSYEIHACLGAADAFAVDPFEENALSPRVIARAAAMARALPGQPLLIATEDTISRPLSIAVLRELMVTGERQQVMIAGRSYWVYEAKGVGTQ